VEEIAWHRRTRVLCAEPFMLRLLKEGRPASSGGWNTSLRDSPSWCGFDGPRVECIGAAIVPRIGGRIAVWQGRRPLRSPQWAVVRSSAISCAHHFHKWWPARSCNARMLKIIRRLNPDAVDPCNDLPERPMGMHWSTHDRLVQRYER